MSRSKKLFLIFSAVFMVALIYASYDIGSRTTFPGSKPQLKERIEREFMDSVRSSSDSAKSGKINSNNCITKIL